MVRLLTWPCRSCSRADRGRVQATVATEGLGRRAAPDIQTPDYWRVLRPVPLNACERCRPEQT